ncbi:MAG: glycosyltransferase [Gammaproteobacteria bacterium]|nr:glycosyltransferase [Gammaproteobacteria bacterium]
MEVPVARIELFVDNFERGGTQAQLVHLANGLAKNPAFDVSVGCLSRRGPLLSALEIAPERITEYPTNRFYNPRGLWQISRLARHVMAEGLDLIHALDFYANIMCSAAAGLNPRTKLVVSRRYEVLTDRRLHRIGEWWSYRLADAVVMNSEHIMRAVASRGLVSRSKVKLIPNGIDLARFESGPPPVDGSQGGGESFRVGVVARLCADKGLDVLLAAAARLVETWQQLEFVLVGEGEQREELETEIRRRGLGGSVRLAGAQADVRPWIASFDIAVLPSYREGLPNALLEYLAMGRPVVATRVGGVSRVLKGGSVGVLVPPGDPQSLAAAIDGLLRDAARRAELAQAARARAQDYGLERMLEATITMYESLLSGSSAPGD